MAAHSQHLFGGKGTGMADNTIHFTDGAAYDHLMAPWSRAAGKVFLDWLAMPAGLRWLGVGCGTGAFPDLLVEPAKPRGGEPRRPPRGPDCLRADQAPGQARRLSPERGPDAAFR